jgi:hypothetical protein
MLKVVEYGLFAVSLLTILGLIISGATSRARTDKSAPDEAPGDSGAAPLGSVRRP